LALSRNLYQGNQANASRVGGQKRSVLARSILWGLGCKLNKGKLLVLAPGFTVKRSFWHAISRGLAINAMHPYFFKYKYTRLSRQGEK